jgi:hypothetical protein
VNLQELEKMVKKIELTQGKYTIVDDEDYEFLNQWQWHVNRKKCKTSSDLLYAKRFEKRKTITMHRLILNAPKGMDVDHINGNGLDNRKCNLRIVSHRENMQNLTKFKGTSKYPGVYWHKEKQKWHVKFKIGEKNHHVGYFVDEKKAYDAYLEATKDLN